MGSNPPELSLDFRPSFVPATIGDLLREVSAIGDTRARSSRLDGYVARLQEEMSKIDAFKRELPLCMLLLNDAILALKMELEQCTEATTAQPVLEEFIPLKKNKDEDDDEKLELKEETDDSKDKKNWMSSVQLWNTDNSPSAAPSSDLKQELKLETTVNQGQTPSATEDVLETCEGRNGGRPLVQLRGYLPFSATPVTSAQEEKMRLPVQGLSLLSSGINNPREKSFCADARIGSGGLIPSPAQNVQSNLPSRAYNPQQTARKQRRCWSPELHRRFVNALQQLGGSQVATPKQIRELMQVDGLTNDEVKSHLQKYRLHTRRISSATSSPADQAVAVLRGLWMSQDQYVDSSKGSSSQSDSPQGPFQLAGSMGATTSTTGGNSMEDDEEDEKSECYSWKSHVKKPGNVDV